MGAHHLEKVFLNILPALGACLSFYETFLLLENNLQGYYAEHHEWFFRCSQFFSWVRKLRTRQNHHPSWDSFHPDRDILVLCIIEGRSFARFTVWLLVSYILQSRLMLLVGCKTFVGDPSSVHSVFVIQGTLWEVLNSYSILFTVGQIFHILLCLLISATKQY